jgi:hypothetical protein
MRKAHRRRPRHFGLWPTATSNLERELRRDDALASASRDWLNAA